MFEVIIERPRGGAGWGRKDRGVPWRVLDHDDDGKNDGGPRKGRMKPLRRSKWLSENLAPLRRFLRSRVGRPWNEVHAEMCSFIAPRSAVQKHVLDHMWGYVETDAVTIDGWPHRLPSWGAYGYSPLTEGMLYVCPESGILKQVKQSTELRLDVRMIDGTRGLLREGEAWFLLTFAAVPGEWDMRKQCFDVVLKRRLNASGMTWKRGMLQRTYGRMDVYAVAKEQPRAQEIPGLLRAAERLAEKQAATRSGVR